MQKNAQGLHFGTLRQGKPCKGVNRMQPKMCCKCKKNVAVIFITKVENGVTLNEGYCIKCARSSGIPQIDQAVNRWAFPRGLRYDLR